MVNNYVVSYDIWFVDPICLPRELVAIRTESEDLFMTYHATGVATLSYTIPSAWWSELCAVYQAVNATMVITMLLTTYMPMSGFGIILNIFMMAFSSVRYCTDQIGQMHRKEPLSPLQSLIASDENAGHGLQVRKSSASNLSTYRS